MTKEIKYMSIKEFRALGFVQEINRRLLHPCGLALEVIVDPGSGEETLGGVWDYRDDPEGIIFGTGELKVEKFESVEEHLASKMNSRHSLLGYVIQPVDDV